MKKLDRKQMAAHVARDIPEGAYVNLGIGLPTMVADYLPKGREIEEIDRRRRPPDGWRVIGSRESAPRER